MGNCVKGSTLVALLALICCLGMKGQAAKPQRAHQPWRLCGFARGLPITQNRHSGRTGRTWTASRLGSSDFPATPGLTGIQ